MSVDVPEISGTHVIQGDALLTRPLYLSCPCPGLLAPQQVLLSGLNCYLPCLPYISVVVSVWLVGPFQNPYQACCQPLFPKVQLGPVVQWGRSLEPQLGHASDLALRHSGGY